ncbi:MAG: beta-hexosaminidase, partial [Enterococcus sp.]|nr:beta-hexosaminidase [Enterococcus sp.]
MKKRIFMSVLMLSAIVALAACGGSDTQNSTGSDTKETTETSSKKEQTNSTDKKSSVETKVDKLMEKMTLEEKVGQLFLARVPEQNQIADIENYHLGGYLLFDRDMEGKGQSELKQTIASYQ